MPKVAPCLWFNGDAEDAVSFYVSLLPDSKISHVQRNPVDGPAGPAGNVLVIHFTLAGRDFMALNAARNCEFTHAVSLMINCADQAEIDRLWDGFSKGGTPVACGWITDRFGLSWQIVPAEFPTLIGGTDTARSARVMQAMMQMVKLDIATLKKAYAG